MLGRSRSPLVSFGEKAFRSLVEKARGRNSHALMELETTSRTLRMDKCQNKTKSKLSIIINDIRSPSPS